MDVSGGDTYINSCRVDRYVYASLVDKYRTYLGYLRIRADPWRGVRPVSLAGRVALLEDASAPKETATRGNGVAQTGPGQCGRRAGRYRTRSSLG